MNFYATSIITIKDLADVLKTVWWQFGSNSDEG